MTENILIISEDGKTVVKCTDKNIENVVIPEGIECIGKEAFKRCIHLKNIQFPSSLFSIDYDAFYDCENLEEVDLSASNLDSIKLEAFAYCKKLTSVKLPYAIGYIGRLAFKNCSNLSNIELPPKEISIENNAFAGCPIMNSEHKSLKIKNGLVIKGKSIVGHTIEQSTLDLQIPKGVEVIESYGISFDKLHVLKIGNGITKIQADAILSYSLCLLWLPPTLKKISTEAFGGECNPAVIINETKINMSFPGSTILPKKENTDYYLQDEKFVIEKDLTSGKKTLIWACPNFDHYYVEVPDDITSIHYDAFRSCEDHTIYLPKIFKIDENFKGKDEIQEYNDGENKFLIPKWCFFGKYFE